MSLCIAIWAVGAVIAWWYLIGVSGRSGLAEIDRLIVPIPVALLWPQFFALVLGIKIFEFFARKSADRGSDDA